MSSAELETSSRIVFLPENSDCRSRARRKIRKTWRPIRLSRLPSLLSSTRWSDLPIDQQHPISFSGYTASSDDSSSAHMSDPSSSHSESSSSSDERKGNNNQELARKLMRRSSLRRRKSITIVPTMKMRRPPMKKLSGGADPNRKLIKSRPMKLSTSERSRAFRRYANSSKHIDSESPPHYLKPTSSSDSKKVQTQERARNTNTLSTSKRSFGGLTRTASFRPSRTLTKMASMRSKRPLAKKLPIQDSGILKATCSSTLKDPKFRDQVGEINELENASGMKVCPYSYCSLHGQHHDNVPPLKRFVSMRRRMLKNQKSMKLESRSSIMLKRSFSKKKGNRTSQVIGDRNDSESNMKDQEANNSTEVVSHDPYESIGSTFAGNENLPVVGSRKRWMDQYTNGEEGKQDPEPTCLSDSECRTETEKLKNIKLACLIHQHMVRGLNEEAGTSQATNKEEKSHAVGLVQKAFDEILSEIPDYSTDNNSIAGDTTSEHQHADDKTYQDYAIQREAHDAGEAKHVAENALAPEDVKSESKAGKKSKKQSPKKWSYLKKVILFRRFVKELENVRNFDLRKPDCRSVEPDQDDKIQLRPQSTGERKNAKEWMLDYALRQVISTFAPSQKRKVALLVQAFETVIPTDSIRTHLVSSRPEAPHGKESLPGILLDSVLCKEADRRENMDKFKVFHPKECDNLSSMQDQNAKEDNEERISVLYFDSYKSNLDSNRKTKGNAATEITDEMTAESCRMGSDESMGSITNPSAWEQPECSNSSEEEKKGESINGNKAEKQSLVRWRNLIYKHMLTGINAEDEAKQQVHEEEQEEDTALSNHVREDGYAADSRRHVVKLVQQALEKIFSEFPDRSSDEQNIAASFSTEPDGIAKDKPDLKQAKCIISSATGTPGEKVGITSNQNTVENWSNLGKVIALKRFVKALEKVRNFNPRKPRYLPMKPDTEVERIQLRNLSVEDKRFTEEWMLDYALRNAISALTPAQRRKVALLVQAFDTVLDGGGQVLPLKDIGTCVDSPISSHGTPGLSKTDIAVQTDCEMDKENAFPNLIEGYDTSETSLKQQLSSICEFSLNEQHIPAPYQKLQGTSGVYDNNEQPICMSTFETSQRDLKITDSLVFNYYIVKKNSTPAEEQPQPGEPSLGDESSAECSSEPTCTSDVIHGNKTEMEKNIKLWNLVYRHIVTNMGVQKREENNPTHGADTLDSHQSFSKAESVKDHHACRQNIKTSGDNVIKLVQRALDKILSEIPDISSDDQSICSDITKDHEIVENSCEVDDASSSTSSNPATANKVEDPDEVQHRASKAHTFEQSFESESNQKISKSWSNLKKVILLKRFVKSLETLTNVSPRNPRYLPAETDPEAEKIWLMHQSTGGKKNAEEWMLDYALQQVISTLAPSQRKKVALLAQAFDKVSLKDIGKCSTPEITSPSHMPLQSRSFSSVQTGNETSSEIHEKKSSDQPSGNNKQAACVLASQSNHEDAKKEQKHVVPGTDNSLITVDKIPTNGALMEKIETKENLDSLEDYGNVTTNNPISNMVKQADKSGIHQEDYEEDPKSELFLQGSPKINEIQPATACNSNLEKQKYFSLWRLLSKHMDSNATKDERNQPLIMGTGMEGEKNDEKLPGRNTSGFHLVDSGKENNIKMENNNSDEEEVEHYHTEAIKLLEEAIDEISLPETQDDSRGDQSVSSDKIPVPEFLEEKRSKEDRILPGSDTIRSHEDPNSTQKTEREPRQMHKSWNNLKKLILLKRFVKALEKVRKFNPREPPYLPPTPEAEGEKVNLKHQEMQDRKHGEEWMLDHALQEVVAKLTPARKRKVQLLVQAFETVTPASAN